MVVIPGNFGDWRQNKVAWAKHQAQGLGDTGQPEVERQPDEDGPGVDTDDVRDVPDGLGAPPPFTGEDMEDIPNRPRLRDHQLLYGRP